MIINEVTELHKKLTALLQNAASNIYDKIDGESLLVNIAITMPTHSVVEVYITTDGHLSSHAETYLDLYSDTKLRIKGNFKAEQYIIDTIVSVLSSDAE